MTVRVCVAIGERTTAQAAEAAARAAQWADLVEIRADFIRDLDLNRLLCEKHGPILFTLRPANEGGEYIGAERARLETLLEAARLGADYVDVEYSAFWQAVLENIPKSKVVLSHHNFDETPADLPSLVEKMAVTGAGVVKVATRALCLSDNLRIASLLAWSADRGISLCALAMGREGMVSRILGPHWGSWMTYASLPGAEGTADGQIPADEMTGFYRVRSLGKETRLYGVLGRPLGHSLSPRLHNEAFASKKMDAVYLPLECTGLADFLEFDAAFPVEGVSVTIPYKKDAHACANSLAIEADQTGAVNTLIRKSHGWHGENTDVDGFTRPLRRRFHTGRMRALVLGCGGAARAVVCGLRSQGASVCIAARNLSKARALADFFQAESISWDQLERQRWDLLVNTTPVGMYPGIEMTPVPAELLTGKWVYDLVYNPRETRLLKEAAARGCGTISGAEMFLGQAIKQHQLWCGTPPPEGVMEAALETALSGRAGHRKQGG